MYIIAIFSQFTGINQIFPIVASNEIEAAKKALIEHCEPKYRNQDYLDWVNNMPNSFTAIQAEVVNTDLVMSDFITI